MKGNPLYIQARDGILGNHQHMDDETLKWMSTKGDMDCQQIDEIYESFKPLSIEIFESFIPKKSSFNRQDNSTSIHGISHILRVMMYSLVVLQVNKIDVKDTHSLIVASVHDLRRMTDKGDLDHGKRAAKWFLSHSDLFDVGDKLESITYAIEHHNDRSLSISGSKDKYQDKILTIIKTADMLDRYRLPKEKWWPNRKYFRVSVSEGLLNFAQSFTYHTEKAVLNHDYEERVRIIIEMAIRWKILK